MIARLLRSDHVAGWLFVLPAVVLIGLFGIVPIGWSLLLSFQHNDLLTAPSWVGLDNYRLLKSDPVFRDSVRRTLVYTMLFVPISVGGALAIAMLLHARIRFSRFYRTAVFVPVATSTVATGIIFNWLLEPTYGVANYLLGEVGLGPYGFFQNPDQALAVERKRRWDESKQRRAELRQRRALIFAATFAALAVLTLLVVLVTAR